MGVSKVVMRCCGGCNHGVNMGVGVGVRVGIGVGWPKSVSVCEIWWCGGFS